MLHILDVLQTFHVPQTLIVVSNDDDVRVVEKSFKADDYIIGCVTSSDCEDERCNYLTTFRYFQEGSMRNVCMSYKAWVTLRTDIERYLMNHDIFILYTLDDYVQNECIDWEMDARRRGFGNKQNGLNVIVCDDDENFLIHKIE